MNEQEKIIVNWYPGHMAKATREIKEKVNVVDIVCEIVDARAPYSSINPVVKEIVGNKYYLKVFTKIDLADDSKTAEWEKYYKSLNVNVLLVDLNKKESVNKISTKIKEITKPIVDKDIRRGLKPRAIRVMVIGIPNVGKSTFINTLSKKKSAEARNIPGFTRAQKWVHCDGFELLDTPGILWPNLSNNNVGIKLALIGCVKQEILPIFDLTKFGLEYISSNYHDLLISKYGIEYTNFNDYMNDFAKKRGHLLKDNEYDLQRSAMTILNDIKNGNIGNITMEGVEEIYG